MSEVQAIPSGFHTITPVIYVKGAVEALEFYKQALGAEENSRHMTPDGSKVMHSELKIGDSRLFVCDEFPEWGALSPETLGGGTCSFFIYVENSDAAFDRAVEAGATVIMPVADTFWGDRVGAVADPYGHKWNLSTHIKDMTEEEMAAAAQEAFAGTQQKAESAS